ncbi:hypothetical protein D0Y65_005973 [Glycine soja]|uniref:Uncharacterized protein n=1 Tax=Glycine soja TaxID=3848 RepID=A0A445L724_GLYSO|nr:hypothetical protein D0Y65_005973 [Glycine soja]
MDLDEKKEKRKKHHCADADWLRWNCMARWLGCFGLALKLLFNSEVLIILFFSRTGWSAELGSRNSSWSYGWGHQYICYSVSETPAAAPGNRCIPTL